jgi:hypothetical protein
MAFAVQVHQVELIDQSLPFEQIERPVDGAAVYRGIDSPRLAQDLTTALADRLVLAAVEVAIDKLQPRSVTPPLALPC